MNSKKGFERAEASFERSGEKRASMNARNTSIQRCPGQEFFSRKIRGNSLIHISPL